MSIVGKILANIVSLLVHKICTIYIHMLKAAWLCLEIINVIIYSQDGN
jgi:hypothetical protein